VKYLTIACVFAQIIDPENYGWDPNQLCTYT